MEWIRYALVILVLGRTIYTDIRYGIIENRCIGVGLVSGCCLAWMTGGIEGFIEGIKMAVIVLAMLFVLYIGKGLGGGDIKLFCVLAVFFPNLILKILVISFFSAAMLAVIQMIVRWIKKIPVYRKNERIIFTIPIGMGVLIASQFTI